MGRDDISALVFKTPRLHHLLKHNNATKPQTITPENIPYYIYRHKGYDDYGIISRTISKMIGPYWQIDKVTDPTIIFAWNDPNNKYFNKTCPHYQHYLMRTKKFDLKKIMVKYPYTHYLMNGRGQIATNTLAVPPHNH